MDGLNRRGFIKGVIGAGVSLVASDNLSFGAKETSGKLVYDAKGLPTTLLGSTGVTIPKMVLGLGSRFCHIDNAEESYQLLNYALDNGLYYWDTAHIYDNSIAPPPGKKMGPEHIISEVRVGEVVKYRRKEIFLSTKVTARNPDEAMKQIELSLRRLQTDRLDMLKIHDVKSLEDVEQMCQKGNLIEILQRLKEEGVTRFIGFSGHGDASALKEMTIRAKFDSMLIAMNHWRAEQNFKRQEVAIPAGKERNMGILLMKAVRPKELIPGLIASDLVRYAMSLEGPDAVVVGMDRLAVVNANLKILRTFEKLSPGQMKELAVKLEPFYRHENLPWMRDNYLDGLWNC